MRKYLNGLLIAALTVLALAPAGWAGIGTTIQPYQMQFQGSVPDQGQLIQYLNDIKNNGAPIYGAGSVTSAVNVNGGTLSAPNIFNGYILQPQAALTGVTLTFASAAAMVSALPGAGIGNTFTTWIANFSGGTLTTAAGAGCTAVGTLTIAQSAVRTFVTTITAVSGTPTCAISSVFAQPSATL